MRSLWLQQQHRGKLLLFLNGWGMDEQPFHFLSSGCYDVLMLYAYEDLTLPFNPAELFSAYHEVYVLAWSLGVWVCQILKDILPRHTVFSLAINGTLQPIHATYGISPRIFNSTLLNLTPTTRDNFYSNMFPGEEEARRFLLRPPRREFSSQVAELNFLKQAIEAETPSRAAMGFDRALIGAQDWIMPAKNQMRFWRNQSTCQALKTGHFPFYLWQRWEDIFVYVSHE